MFKPSSENNLPLYQLLKGWAAYYYPHDGDQEKLVIRTLHRIEDLDTDPPVGDALFKLMHETFLWGTADEISPVPAPSPSRGPKER